MSKLRAIFKFKIPAERCFHDIAAPACFEPVSVQFQESSYGSGLMLWARVDRDAPAEVHKLAIVFTGDNVDDKWQFVATVQRPDGIMLHVFLVRE